MVEEVERRHRQDEHNFFMRVRVALPLEKPIKRGSFIAGSDGIRSWVKFKYERLPRFCDYCGLLASLCTTFCDEEKWRCGGTGAELC